MGSTLAASRPARIRDKYGRDHAAVADVEASPPPETRWMAIASEETTALDVERLDRIVATSRAAADAFRRIGDQEAVDRIVWAMVVAGLQHAVELAQLAMEETGLRRLRGQGGQELHRHRVPLRLPEGQALGRRHRGGPRAGDPVRRGADRRGARAHADHQPDLDRAVQGDRRGQDAQRVIFRPSARAARLRRARRRDPPGGRRARRDAAGRRCRSSPTPRSTSPSTSSTTPASTSSGPPAGRRRSPRPTRPASRASASAPATRPSTSTAAPTCRMAVVDMLISKTFDASVICPAEQTCIIDDAVWDATLGRAPAHGRAPAVRRGGGARWRRSRSTTTASPSWRSLGQSCVSLGGLAGFEAGADDKVLLAPLPSDLDELARPPARAREADAGARARPLAVGRARAARCRARAPSTAGMGHTSAVYATDEDVIDAFADGRPHRPHPRQRADGGRRARRRLQRDDADLLARLRHLGRLDHHRQRQLPQPAQHQGRLAPADAAAVVPRPVGHLLQPRRARAACASLRARPGAARHRRRHRGARRGRRGAPSPRRRRCACSPTSSPSPREAQVRAGVEVLESCGRT